MVTSTRPPPARAKKLCNAGTLHATSGRLDAALACYDDAIRLFPAYATAHSNRGNVLASMGRLDDAIACHERAIFLEPGHADNHCNLGVSLQSAGRLADAAEAYRAAMRLAPGHLPSLHNLGSVLSMLGHHDEAIACHRRVVAELPRHPDAHVDLGDAERLRGDTVAATECYRHAISIDPGHVRAHFCLAETLESTGHYDDALAAGSRALALAPDDPTARATVARVLVAIGRASEAIEHYRAALSIDPNHVAAHVNLGTVLQSQGRFDEAETCFRHALRIEPTNQAATNNLAGVLLEQCRGAEAISCADRLLDATPDDAVAHSNRLFALLHLADQSAESIWQAHRAFADRFETPLQASQRPHDCDRSPDRRLRVGFVSGDLRGHTVAQFVEPTWNHLPRERIELYAYYNHTAVDDTTRRLMGLVHRWEQVSSRSDAEFADLVRRDGIDILIDLSGHTAHNRLLAFARKPAPILATWLGYPGTTGLVAMDYMICDRYNAPDGRYERFHSEKFARIPSAAAFEPAQTVPIVPKSTMLTSGPIVFGSFNRGAKIGEPVLETFSRILREAQGSRLIMCHGGDTAASERVRAAFAVHGVSSDRLEFYGRLPLGDYLELHNRVHIALDTWPYTGGTTTQHALQMGVPVVTVRGPSRAHCQSAAGLARLGLEDWAADDVAGYEHVAVSWASDRPRLAALLEELPKRWRFAPRRQGAFVAKGLELALRHMWHRWCRDEGPEHFEISQESIDAERTYV